ncbi:MAG: hypothetical protein LC660_18065, partial [Desulfobacteraceae bacterium]|nr:hypothetical protein [Desulfobacteraceae bacterium]
AKKPLGSHHAQKGDDLILAMDLHGKRGCKSVVSWDANSGKTPEELLYRLETLPMIAEQEWCCAAKDISNAGILGTVSIFLENSGKGGEIFVSAIPKPADIDLIDWLCCFQSFGFILAVRPEHSKKVLALFSKRNIDAQIIGEVTDTDRVVLDFEHTSRVLFDFNTDEITGIRYKKQP